jgi:NADH-quinone oxidoreductase subunit C
VTTGDRGWQRRVLASYAALDVVRADDGGYGPLSVDVPPGRWAAAVRHARDQLGCAFFDFLTAVDELDAGMRVVCHVAAHRPGAVDHLVLRTLVSGQVQSVAHVYAGAAWHERETAEMFGLAFTGTDGEEMSLPGLLLPDGFEGHPLRKDFVLASRVVKPWPGAKEPGESDAVHAAGHTPARRRVRPPGVPEDWPRGAPPPADGGGQP